MWHTPSSGGHLADPAAGGTVDAAETVAVSSVAVANAGGNGDSAASGGNYSLRIPADTLS